MTRKQCASTLQRHAKGDLTERDLLSKVISKGVNLEKSKVGDFV